VARAIQNFGFVRFSQEPARPPRCTATGCHPLCSGRRRVLASPRAGKL